MNETPSIKALRLELGLTQSEFAARLGLANKASVSLIERGGPCSSAVALAIERLSAGRIDAAALNSEVAAARAAVEHRTHEPASAVNDCLPACDPAPANLGAERGTGWQLTEAELAALPDLVRVAMCEVCDAVLDDARAPACTFVECPHRHRVAA